MTYPTMPPIPPAVAAIIDGYPSDVRAGVLSLRALIFDVARDLPQVGVIEECLKWQQPAYLTAQTGAGSTLRIGPHRQACFALFAHCRTTIISDYTQAFPGWDRIDGNRAVLFDAPGQIEPERLRHLIRHGLSYHLPSPIPARG